MLTVNSDRYQHLEGLELADGNCDVTDDTIDLLIGSDYYWTVVMGEVLESEPGLVAVSSKLGWLVSGPLCDLTDSRSTHCNAIVANNELPCSVNDSLVTMLRQFWDTGSIGIVPDSRDDQSTQTFWRNYALVKVTTKWVYRGRRVTVLFLIILPFVCTG